MGYQRVPRPDKDWMIRLVWHRSWLIVALAIATTVWFETYPRFESIGPELLRNGELEDGLDGWSKQGEGSAVDVTSGNVKINNVDSSRTVGIRQTVSVLPNHRFLMLSADFATENVVPGAKPWQMALIQLVGRTVDGKYLWQNRHMLVRVSGSTDQSRISEVFEVSNSAVDVQVTVLLVHATGFMRVGHLSLLPMRERTDFRVLAYGLLALWCAATVWVGIPIVQRVALCPRKGLLGIAAMAVLIGALIPVSAKQAVLELIQPTSKELTWEQLYYWGEIAAKGLHFSLFFILAMAIRFAFPTTPIAVQMAHLILFAACIEVLQYFAVGRAPGVGDWMVDVAGIALAFALFWLFRRDPPVEAPGQDVDL